MKTYTREELSALTPEQLESMSTEEKANALDQGRAFRQQDIEKVEQSQHMEKPSTPQYNIP